MTRTTAFKKAKHDSLTNRYTSFYVLFDGSTYISTSLDEFDLGIENFYKVAEYVDGQLVWEE